MPKLRIGINRLPPIVFAMVVIGLVVVGCSGYKIRRGKNPLQSYGIRSVAVPMFVNHSIFPNVSGPLTREITRVLTQYEGLQIYSGEDKQADAILVGVITSRKRKGDALKPSAISFTSGGLKNLIGDRNDFFIGIQSSYEMKLQVTLIKDPSQGELKVLRSELAKHVVTGPNIIFNEEIKVVGSYPRKVFERSGFTDVNFTYTKGLHSQNFQSVAKSAANIFKEVVLNAF